MFSTTPISSWSTCWAMRAARRATRWAVGWGVVTTSTWARGRNWAIDMEMSPVPGGMSTTRKSRSSQKTSLRNCSMALCSIGPRQMTALSSDEIVHRHDPYAVRPGRDDRLVDHHRRPLHSEHPGDREPPDVAVDDAHRVASLGQGDGEVGADRRLANTALAGRNGHDPGPIAGLANLGPDLGAEPLHHLVAPGVVHVLVLDGD